MGNALFLPFGVAGLYTAGFKLILFGFRNLVVGNEDAPAVAAVLGIQQVDRVQRRTGTGKEVNNEGVGFVGDKESNGIVDSIERFGERKGLVSKYFSQHSATVPTCIVRRNCPLC